MHELSRRGYINPAQTRDDFVHNKKVEAVTLELVKLEKVMEEKPYQYVLKVFGQRSLNDMIKAGILENHAY